MISRLYLIRIRLNGFTLAQSRRSFVTQSSMGSSNENVQPLELPELPSPISNWVRQDSSRSALPFTVGRSAYAGIAKQQIAESAEFQIHNEDFPELPRSQLQKNDEEDTSSKKLEIENGFDLSKGTNECVDDESCNQFETRGIQTNSDGTVTNIPAGMVPDQFGMIGLLTTIRAAKNNPNLATCSLGCDLTTLGLNLNSSENIYPIFDGPFTESRNRPQDMGKGFDVPPEYLVNSKICDKLAPVKFDRYGEDLLLFLYYTNVGDLIQILVAAELFNRGWRYHTEERIWITKPPGMVPVEKTSVYERGFYYYFDSQNWRKGAKEFLLEYEKLDGPPQLPNSF